MDTKKNCWPDGRPKVWFELYVEKTDVDSALTLTACVTASKKRTLDEGAFSIYEVHSMGGWKSEKEDKITKVFKVLGGKAVQRHFKKGW